MLKEVVVPKSEAHEDADISGGFDVELVLLQLAVEVSEVL